MPSLVATTSALARIMCVRTHYVRTNMLLQQARPAAVYTDLIVWLQENYFSAGLKSCKEKTDCFVDMTDIIKL